MNRVIQVNTMAHCPCAFVQDCSFCEEIIFAVLNASSSEGLIL